MEDGWVDTLNKKARELDVIATWASILNLGQVRDHCRFAASAIRDEVARLARISREAEPA